MDLLQEKWRKRDAEEVEEPFGSVDRPENFSSPTRAGFTKGPDWTGPGPVTSSRGAAKGS